MTELEKKQMLQSAIYHLLKSQPFYGNLMQELTLRYSEMVPTAGIAYDTKQSQYVVYINPSFFAQLKVKERIAVFHHELLHFVHNHLFILPFTDTNISNEEKKIYNVAGDMAINQYIKDLPTGSVDIAQWKLDDGSPFPPIRDMVTYHDLIKAEKVKQEKGKTQGNVHDQLDKFKDFDQHFWDSLDEETKQKMLEEAKKVFRRAVEKATQSRSSVPGEVQDLLRDLETQASKLNHKGILKSVIKKTVSCVDRETTWNKPNKRYGVYSPGTKIGALPKLNIYVDTSGSISLTEMNIFLRVVSDFLKVGTRQCNLALWHTSLYHKQRYKLHEHLNPESVKSGGTDINCVLEDIIKTKGDLSIVLTDGYYERSALKPNTEVIWIISSGGDTNHPMKIVGKTISLENLK